MYAPLSASQTQLQASQLLTCQIPVLAHIVRSHHNWITDDMSEAHVLFLEEIPTSPSRIQRSMLRPKRKSRMPWTRPIKTIGKGIPRTRHGRKHVRPLKLGMLIRHRHVWMWCHYHFFWRCHIHEMNRMVGLSDDSQLCFDTAFQHIAYTNIFHCLFVQANSVVCSTKLG